MHNVDVSTGSGEIDEAFERRLEQALATAPPLKIPADFAARVASRVPASTPVALPRTAYARNSIILSALVLLIALLVVAPKAVHGLSFATGLEWLLCGQLSLLAIYAMSPRSPWRSRD